MHSISSSSAAFDPSRDDAPQPHQLANELTSDPAVQEDAALPVAASNPHSLRVERSVGRFVAVIVLGAVVIGLIVAAAMFRQWTLVLIGALFVIPFVLLVSAPVWLAGATKVAQDETVREQREGDTRDDDA